MKDGKAIFQEILFASRDNFQSRVRLKIYGIDHDTEIASSLKCLQMTAPMGNSIRKLQSVKQLIQHLNLWHSAVNLCGWVLQICQTNTA